MFFYVLVREQEANNYKAIFTGGLFSYKSELISVRRRALIEQLQPKPQYINLFKEIVLDVWRQRQADTITLVQTLESRLDNLKAKRQRVVDAFLHERLIDIATYQEQLDLLNEQIALADLEIYETKIEELDLEASLNFATNALSDAAAFWLSALVTKQRFQGSCFQRD